MNSDARRSEDDAQLAKRIADGDSEAFDFIYRRFCLRLHRIAWAVCGDRAEASDIVHDVLLKLWENARRFDARRGSVFSWLAASTRNRAIDWIRTRRRRTALLSGYWLEEASNEAVESSSADQEAAINDDRQAMLASLASLPRPMSEALHLTYFECLNNPEAAALLRAPLGTVKSRIRRGLLQLRRATIRASRHSSSRPAP